MNDPQTKQKMLEVSLSSAEPEASEARRIIDEAGVAADAWLLEIQSESTTARIFDQTRDHYRWMWINGYIAAIQVAQAEAGVGNDSKSTVLLVLLMILLALNIVIMLAG